MFIILLIFTFFDLITIVWLFILLFYNIKPSFLIRFRFSSRMSLTTLCIKIKYSVRLPTFIGTYTHTTLTSKQRHHSTWSFRRINSNNNIILYKYNNEGGGARRGLNYFLLFGRTFDHDISMTLTFGKL